MLRVVSVMLKSAWVTESCSSRARCARSSLAASSPACRCRSSLEAHLLAEVAHPTVGAAELVVDHDRGCAHVGGHAAVRPDAEG